MQATVCICMYSGPFTIVRYNHCLWRLSSDILHCATVCPHNVTLTHWWVNGEHCLVGTHNRIHYSLGLLVGSIESYHSSISPPGDSGSRSTSGDAGEGWLIIISQTGYPGGSWKCWEKLMMVTSNHAVNVGSLAGMKLLGILVVGDSLFRL